ncbi:MAG: TonB-dependent receptor plug domain-containing protein [Opitutaceae bacterium]
MPTSNPTASCLIRHLATMLGILAAAHLHGQATTAAAPTADNLAKYDQNKNGVLDPAELQQMQADEAKNGEAIKLNPFEVSTSKDSGYAAGNTLSGGRVDTPLAITPGSISVMTKEFLDDFNITNINDASAWTIGMDIGTVTPNSDSSGQATYQAIFRGAPSDQNFPTRNGSLNFGTADSYNTERFEFSRGPDTSMFGDGGPGGRQGSSSKRPRFNSTATSLGVQVDNFGGYRATLDYGKGWDRFALRVNGLRQNNKPYQDDIDRIKNAATIAAAIKLTKNTQFIAEFERVGEWNNLYSVTVADTAQFWDNRTTNDNNTTLIANPNSVGLEQVSATVDYYVWNFGINELVNYRGVQYRTRGTAYRIPYTGNPYIPASPARAFPSGIDRHFNLTAADNVVDRDNDTLALTLEHRAGNFFMQAGYVRNNFDINTVWANGSPNEYRVDVNRLLPDGRANAYFLRGYADAEQNRNYNQDAVREFKGLASYRFFVPRFFDYKQQLSLNLGHRRTNAETRTDAWRRADNPLQADPFNAANILRIRYYWDAPRPKVAPVFTNPNDTMPGRWVLAQTAGTMAERQVEYAGLISQSAFFNEKLALTASIRRDDVSVDALPRFGSTGAPFYQNVLGSGAPGVHIKRSEAVVSTAAGLVAYPFPNRNEGVKRWLGPLGFVFNFAENNQPPGSGSQPPLISGEDAPLTHSTTKDWGLRYSVPGGKVYLTVTHYNTDQEDIVSGFGSQGDIRNLWLNLGYNDQKLTTTEFSYSDLSARKLEGWEAELTANPWRDLTLTVNYSHPRVYIQSESVGRKAYVEANMAEWKAGAALTDGAVLNGRTILNSQILRDSLLNIENSLNGLTTGTLANDSTNHRINVAARYAFREGMLRGFAFNGGVNYRSYTKSSSRDARIKFGLPDSTTPTPQQNVAAAFDYLWVPPSYFVSAGANYTRRFGKYQTRFQLNISNLLDWDKPVWGRNTTGGTGGAAYTVLSTNQLLNGNPRMQVLSGWAAVDPRKITFSTTVSF